MIEKLKGLLIEDWQHAWKLATVWAAALLGLIDLAGEHLPMAAAYLPQGWVKYAALAIIVARIFKQNWRKT